jgi:hypothetical protein
LIVQRQIARLSVVTILNARARSRLAPFWPAFSSPPHVFGGFIELHSATNIKYYGLLSAFVELSDPEPASVPDAKLGFLAEQHRKRLEAAERFTPTGIDVEDVYSILDQ